VVVRQHLPKNKSGQRVNADALWLGLAMVLVVEGLLPFLSPGAWRRMFTQILQLQDGQIRFFGLCSMGLGLLLIWLQ
jgi:uncharacterized protein YjeT (DUF2065 family)